MYTHVGLCVAFLVMAGAEGCMTEAVDQNLN